MKRRKAIKKKVKTRLQRKFKSNQAIGDEERLLLFPFLIIALTCLLPEEKAYSIGSIWGWVVLLGTVLVLCLLSIVGTAIHELGLPYYCIAL